MLVGDWKFDETANELMRDDERIKLEPQCALVLHYLCEHAGEVVSRDALLDAVWGRESVSIQSVPVVISKLRTLLGDDKRQPEYIETVTKRGYRLIAPVRNSAEPSRRADQLPPPSLNVKRAGLWVAAILGSLGVVFAASFVRTPPASQQTLYVADVANLTNDSRFNAVASGASELLSTELARPKELSVVRLRRNPLDNTWVTPNLVEPALSSAPLLTTSIVLTKQGKSMVMQLAGGKERRIVWSHDFPIEDDAFAADQRQAANQLFKHLGVPENTGSAAIAPALPGVEELYLRAKFFWGLRGRENNVMAADLARKALTLDPAYAPAHALLAEAYAKYSADYLGVAPADTMELATEHLARAIAAEPLHPATLMAQTRLLMLLDRRPDLALEVAEKAIRLGVDDSMIYLQRAACLYLLGRIDEAQASIARAVEIEYGSPYVEMQYIMSNYLGGRFQEVVDIAEGIEPDYYDDFRAQVAASYYEIGDHQKAMRTWFDALHSSGLDVGIKDDVLRLIETGDTAAAYQALSEYVDGIADAGDLQIQTFQLYWSFYYGDAQAPLLRLQSIPITRHTRFLLWLHRWPLFDRYAQDADFQDYLRNIGVAPLANCVHPVCAAH